jgi:predicted  nucleic acid-binding Zn-ribbon protein
MPEDSQTPLQKLVLLSKIDVALAQIDAERKKSELTLAAKRTTLKTLKDQLTAKKAVSDDRKSKYNKEEKAIKEEQDKLVARRKALASFGNYKVQQAAEKEIEQVGKMLSAREDQLLILMEEVEKISNELKALTEKHEAQAVEFETLAGEVSALVISLEERHEQKTEERRQYAANIPKNELLLYDKVRNKYPMNAVMPIINGACTGCYMSVVPQVISQVIKGSPITRCPGCARILYIETPA